jgi:uncharacterized OB-fold protein
VRAAAADLFELDGTGGIRLVGGFSPTSGRHHVPLGEACPYSGAADVERVLLSDRGTLWGWTAVTVPPPGYRGEVPYGFGIVELTQEQLLVVSRLTEPDPGRLSFGAPMRLVADIVFTDDDGTDIVTWAFAPER